MKKIRPLRADEVECRVAQVTSKGCQLLLYKDSRCDKRILDETFGICGWQDRYEEIHGRLFCTVSIWDEAKNQWIQKQDCGTESDMEKEKGEASDAFKRACFNIGIGRELYTKIFIWLPVETEKDVKRYVLKDRFAKWHVSEMTVDEKTEKITHLVICDTKNNPAFEYADGKSSTISKPSKAEINPNAPTQICRKCGNEIKGVKWPNGATQTAGEFSEAYGNLCVKCAKEERVI